MWKKFLSAVVILGLFSTSAVSALEVTGGTGSGATIPSYISSFQVTPATFNPGANQTATVSFNLSAGAGIYAYAVDTAFNVYAIAGSAVSPAQTSAGNVSYTWYGRSGNTAGGTVLANGSYTIRAFAYSGNNIVDSDTGTVTISSQVAEPTSAPQISGLTASPSTFSAQNNEDTEVSFRVDQDAYLTVTVVESAKGGLVDVRTFSNYSGDDWYAMNRDHSINWDGKNNNGEVVADGSYTIEVKAINDNGSRTAKTTVQITTAVVSSDIIRDFQLDPSGSWDPTDDEELEISFELNREVDSLRIDAKKGSKTIEILDEDDADDDDYEESWDGTDDDGDYVSEGAWDIIIRADNDSITRTINVVYEKPTITDAFVTKSSFDAEENEFTTLVFKVDTAAEVTVELMQGTRRELKLLDEVSVQKNKWYTVEWNGLDEDGEEADEGRDWKFKITAENEIDDDISDSETVEVDLEEDDVSSNKSNVTNDYVVPVILDEDFQMSATIAYCIDEAADVLLAVYEGTSTSGRAEIELLDYVNQSAGCHTVQWNGLDEDNKELDEGVYSYKLISRTEGNHKDTEVGKFVVGTVGNYVFDDDDDDDDDNCDDFGGCLPPPPTDCGGYWDTGSLGNNTEMCEAISWVTKEGIFTGYADGSYRPYNYINRAEVLKVVLNAFDNMVILPLDGTSQGFPDVDSHAWYMPYVRTARFYAMLEGYPDGQAKLGNHVNRVEFLKFVLEAAQSFSGYYIPNYGFSNYADVEVGSWYSNYAGVAYDYMLFNEYYHNGQYNLQPADLVQRGEVALLLYRMHINGLLDGTNSGFPAAGNGYYDSMNVPLYY